VPDITSRALAILPRTRIGSRRDPDRNACRAADGLDEAIRGVHDFLDGEEVWDEEKAGEEFYEDALTPALKALADVVAGDDLTAMLSGMRTGESAELQCENGTFEIVRDR
jgi:hypothetical protein